MGTTSASFAALDTALLSGPPEGRSAPLDRVEHGSCSGCRARLVYVMPGLLAQMERNSGQSPAVIW
ncbi:hypothetical protein [Streptomyces prunicolor]|uniref:Uncharacterized protein n=1 Tax=Streptomyces prunicolor TaxID=67348 RepID=A0ABU4FMD4_9ACTN|nr:hypothetical protein [Streptomyces prunicolor]MDV7220430.1 hypothetical protein [Streptomyces prunicolor]